ncbi:GNAT family N-acetyltransferase [Micromonospora sp. NPDC047644]|uniref:GNAT family N-acetyltransferase n=1 Tax=Micromonospora sp. NPDC047644 TaxID=3157203 RepID=UPI003454D196
MSSAADRMTAAYFDGFESLVRATPKGWHAARGTARAAVTHSGVPPLNMAYDTTPEPDLGSLDEMATEVGRQGLPWSIMVRGGVGDRVADLAARHGLVERSAVPLLACAADNLVFRASAAQRELVHRVDAAQSDLYTEILAQGFETSEGLFGPLMRGRVLDAPSMAGYLVEGPGRPVGTGFGIRTPGAIGVFNIAVVPPARGQGLGRAITEAVLHDGVVDGADWAYLLPSVMGQPLYRSMGFRLVTRWAMFTSR